MEHRNRRFLDIFLAAESCAYLVMLYLDLFRPQTDTTRLKFCALVGCLLFALYCLVRGGEGLVVAALAFTVGADIFLLLLDRHYLVGVLLFCAVQGLYLYRIVRANGGHALWPVRLGLFLLCLLLLSRLGLLTALNALSVFYFSHFLCNSLQSLVLPGVRMRLFSVGLTLFLCCDLCVAVFNVPDLFPPALFSFAQVGMWLFYLPAQVLIALSALPKTAV